MAQRDPTSRTHLDSRHPLHPIGLSLPTNGYIRLPLNRSQVHTPFPHNLEIFSKLSATNLDIRVSSLGLLQNLMTVLDPCQSTPPGDLTSLGQSTLNDEMSLLNNIGQVNDNLSDAFFFSLFQLITDTNKSIYKHQCHSRSGLISFLIF